MKSSLPSSLEQVRRREIGGRLQGVDNSAADRGLHSRGEHGRFVSAVCERERRARATNVNTSPSFLDSQSSHSPSRPPRRARPAPNPPPSARRRPDNQLTIGAVHLDRERDGQDRELPSARASAPAVRTGGRSSNRKRRAAVSGLELAARLGASSSRRSTGRQGRAWPRSARSRTRRASRAPASETALGRALGWRRGRRRGWRRAGAGAGVGFGVGSRSGGRRRRRRSRMWSAYGAKSWKWPPTSSTNSKPISESAAPPSTTIGIAAVGEAEPVDARRTAYRSPPSTTGSSRCRGSHRVVHAVRGALPAVAPASARLRR